MLLIMFRNYLVTAWRNLLKNKFYTLINIAGLMTGLAIGILILLWIRNELSYDTFEKKGSQIYRLELFGGTGGSRQIWSTDVAPMGPLAKQLLPEVTEQVRMTENNLYSLYSNQVNSFTEEHAVFTDASFFDMFGFSVLRGNPGKPFSSISSVVITRSTALKYYGTVNAVGKILIADRQTYFTVSAVVQDFPQNSFMKDIHMLMSMDYLRKILVDKGQSPDTDFGSFNYMTFLQLKEGTSVAGMAKKLFTIHTSHKADDTDVSYLLLPLAKNYLYNADGTDRGIETVRLFELVAGLILVIACINYVNLSTARSMLRAKEISMRKIAGASRTQLFMQFVVETAVLFLFASFLALVLVAALMPAFNSISGKQLRLDLGDYHVWILTGLTITGSLFASSIYPALLLSSPSPLKAFKGRSSGSTGDALFRKVLVVVQFTFSVVLIIGTLMINRQLSFVHSASLGYDKSHVFSFQMRNMAPHYDAVRAELTRQAGILSVTRSSNNILANDFISGDNDWDGKAKNQTFIVHPLAIDKDLLRFFKIQLLKGTDFTGSVTDTTHFILNEAAVRQIGLKNAIGKRFRLWQVNGTITGVVKDFHFASLREQIAPAVLYYHPGNFSTIYVKTTGSGAGQALQAARTQFGRYNPAFPFSYEFLDSTFDNLYRSEIHESELLNYFTGIAVLISCLGLFGLATFTSQARIREIGVRKVLGASVAGLTALLAADFIKLVLLAILFAIPLAWYAVDSWLSGYAYKTNLSITVFLTSGIIALLIALITLSFQTIRTALASPVKSLRND